MTSCTLRYCLSGPPIVRQPPESTICKCVDKPDGTRLLANESGDAASAGLLAHEFAKAHPSGAVEPSQLDVLDRVIVLGTGVDLDALEKHR